MNTFRTFQEKTGVVIPDRIDGFGHVISPEVLLPLTEGNDSIGVAFTRSAKVIVLAQQVPAKYSLSSRP